MRKACPSLTASIRATLISFIALVVGLIALLSVGTGTAESQQARPQPLYEVRDLGTLGGSFSWALGINDAGKVVGGSSLEETPEGVEEHAFLYSEGQITDLGTLGGSDSIATAINDADEVVGFSTTSDDFEHPFLYSD